MSYHNTRYQIHLMNQADGTTTATFARYAFLMRPVILRRAGIMVVAAGTTTALTVTIKKRVTPATDTGGTTIGTLTMPSATSPAGTAVYLDNLTTEFDFGDEFFAVVTTPTGGAMTFDLVIDVEDAPRNPDSSDNLTEVTA